MAKKVAQKLKAGKPSNIEPSKSKKSIQETEKSKEGEGSTEEENFLEKISRKIQEIIKEGA